MTERKQIMAMVSFFYFPPRGQKGRDRLEEDSYKEYEGLLCDTATELAAKEG